jgi:hypothetical protein
MSVPERVVVTKELCIGSVCVTADHLKALLARQPTVLKYPNFIILNITYSIK